MNTFLRASRPWTTSSTTDRTVTCQSSTPRISTPDAPLYSPAPTPPGNTGRTQRVPQLWWNTTPTPRLPLARDPSMGTPSLHTGTPSTPPWQVNVLYSLCLHSLAQPKSDPSPNNWDLDQLNRPCGCEFCSSSWHRTWLCHEWLKTTVIVVVDGKKYLFYMMNGWRQQCSCLGDMLTLFLNAVKEALQCSDRLCFSTARNPWSCPEIYQICSLFCEN